tara:strand:+ start:143 stop:661 length:519 start_codon:yes stop_codon:yes gene_type:complete
MGITSCLTGTCKPNGIYNYNDLVTVTTPLSVSADTDTLLANDSAGVFTTVALGAQGISTIYNPVSNSFDFSKLSLGDTVFIRVDFEIITQTNNQSVNVFLDAAQGNAINYSIEWGNEVEYKTQRTHKYAVLSYITMLNKETIENPAQLKINTDGAASIKINGWLCKVDRHGY